MMSDTYWDTKGAIMKRIERHHVILALAFGAILWGIVVNADSFSITADVIAAKFIN
jgi:hypothetical protein